MNRIYTGDCREVLKTLPDESVHCVVTSPPYFALRDYGSLCNFLAAVPAKVAMRRAQWWDAKDGSSFNDGAST